MTQTQPGILCLRLRLTQFAPLKMHIFLFSCLGVIVDITCVLVPGLAACNGTYFPLRSFLLQRGVPRDKACQPRTEKVSSFSPPPLKVALFSGTYPVHSSNCVSLWKRDSEACGHVRSPADPNSHLCYCDKTVALHVWLL